MRKFIFTLIFGCLGAGIAVACTSAIVSGKLTKNGRPLLWKHRDASDLNNKVAVITARDGSFKYVALFNSSDPNCNEAWIGYNSEGFAVMNTASYNLKADTVKNMDKEGFLMSRALAKCRTVADFQNLLDTLPKPLGVEANFGVIDARGGAAYFETCNYGYKRYDVDGYMVRTNYSHSGRKDEGYGYIREANAEYLLAPYIKQRNVTPMTFTEGLSRSFYHSLIGKDFSKDTVAWGVDRDFIPRYSSSASVVVEGIEPGESKDDMTMWTALGYPPCAVTYPVWLFQMLDKAVLADPDTKMAPACEQSKRLKAEVFPIHRDRGENYLNLKRLKGISARNKQISLENYRKGYSVLKQHSRTVTLNRE